MELNDTSEEREQRLLRTFKAVHGEMTGSCSASVIFDEENTKFIGVGCVKNGECVWMATIEDLTFDYVTLCLGSSL